MHSSDPDLNARYRTLCGTVGHLFLCFGRFEGVLAAVLKLHLGRRMSGEKMSAQAVGLASAIYGSMRFSAARDIIKRIMKTEETPKPLSDFVLGIFEQAGHIQDLRDRIAHHTVAPAYKGADEYWQVTDAMTTKNIKEPKVYVFSENAVALAADDLVLAGDRLGTALVGPRLFISDGFDASPPPWQYRPSMLKLVPQNKLRNPLGHLRPPPPSQA